MEKTMKLNNRWLNIDLMIGVTRQCNFKCRHCLRGEAENISFDPNLLDSFLKNNNELEYINNLTLTGGEPLFKVKLLNKILDIFRSRNIYISMAYIATNGSAFNKDSIEFLLRLNEYVCEELFVEISNSEYHKEEANRLNLYIPNSLEDIDEFYETSHYDYDISGLVINKEDYDYNSIIFEGRAKKDTFNKELLKKKIRTPNPISRLEEDGLSLYLTETGYVLPRYCDYSFESMRNMDLTRIEDFSIKNYIEEYGVDHDKI
jgi:organic radical activating enzyme